MKRRGCSIRFPSSISPPLPENSALKTEGEFAPHHRHLSDGTWEKSGGLQLATLLLISVPTYLLRSLSSSTWRRLFQGTEEAQRASEVLNYHCD